MKAAVLNKLGELPKYQENFPIPVAENEQQTVLKVLASSVKNLDRGRASGKHYTTFASLPTTVGIDGVVELENGDHAYTFGISGMIAEKALVAKDKWVVLDKGVDPLIAAALPNTVLGADMAMVLRGKIKPGDVVLVNGATGVTGKIAIQLAKYHGASKVIIMGRDKSTLEDLKKKFNVDEVIIISDDDSEVIERVKSIFSEKPIDIVLDYLWGRPIDLIIKGIVASKVHHQTKIVTIGEMAGSNISLPSGTLRSSAIEILGSGLGSFPPKTIEMYMKEHLNTILNLVSQGKLTIDINVIELKDIEKNWSTDVKGTRTVVKIN